VDPAIYVNYSVDSGVSWTVPARLDQNRFSEFLPAIAVDQKNGDVAVTRLDTRNDPNDVLSQLYGTVSGDGASWLTPFQIAYGQSNATRTNLPQRGFTDLGNTPTTLNDISQNWPANYWAVPSGLTPQNYEVFLPSTNESHPIIANTATQLTIDGTWQVIPAAGTAYQIRSILPNTPRDINKFDYGDYTGLAFYNGYFYPVWPDNSDSSNDNPNGLSPPSSTELLDLYTDIVRVTHGAAPNALQLASVDTTTTGGNSTAGAATVGSPADHLSFVSKAELMATLLSLGVPRMIPDGLPSQSAFTRRDRPRRGGVLSAQEGTAASASGSVASLSGLPLAGKALSTRAVNSLFLVRLGGLFDDLIMPVPLR
jgi:hypothetical protein